MAGFLVEASLSAVIQELVSRLFANFFRGKKSMEDQLRDLKQKLETVSLVVNDAEERQISEPNVRKWLDDLRHATLRTEDLVEEIKAEARTKQRSQNHQPKRRKIELCGTPISPDQCTDFDVWVQDEIGAILEDLDSLLGKRVVLRLEADARKLTNSSLKVLPAPLREASNVHGRDDDKDKILKLLLSSDECIWRNKIGVLPIVGMGGLGKTTLAQLVYNDERVKEHQFELRAWVTVSTEFDAFKIMKSLLQQIGATSHTEEPAVLQQKMHEALVGKKFLFVFDDVWDEDHGNWDLLMSNFDLGDSRSKIIVTTRSGKVCSNVKTGPIHELQLVSNEACWKIFVHHAFDGDLNADPELQEIGKSIVDKCKGVPLAVKSVGGLLRNERNPKKWETILRSHVWEWSRNQGSGILPSLWLSYRYLPSSVKQCFAYCAVFPQDYEFDKEDMVLMWMAEGFLQSDTKEKSLEEVGDEYFEDLILRSFFQRLESRYVMHDLVHDLATFVSGEFCLRLCGNMKLGNTSSKTRYLLCNADHESDSVKVLGEAAYLHTYIDEGFGLITDSLVEKVVEAGRFLRVLSVPTRNISELLSSPRNHLKHLRYLNLSGIGIKEVPDSVCTLYSLQTLVLLNWETLSKLPTNMGNLINLRHLDNNLNMPIISTIQIKMMPPRMGNLKELRTLRHFILGKAGDDCSSIKELGELPHLTGKLHICGLQNVETADDARKANFREKGNLVKLVLAWEGEPSDTIREREVLDALQPHTNLEELAILGYAASSFPIWVGDSSFSKMVSLSLKGSSHNLCSSLPPLGQLPKLRALSIESFHWVENIGSEFYGNNSSFTPFPCLESLDFIDMKSWKEWSFAGRDGNESGCFPCLRRLTLRGCPNLGASSLLHCETLETLRIWDSYYSLECFPLDKFPSLQNLTLNGCLKLKSLTGSTEDSSLTSLEIQNCPELESFPEGGLPLSLKSLQIWRCPELESFPEGGLPLSLKSLNIDNCRKVVAQNRHWDLQRLTSLTELKIWDDRDAANNLESFPEGLLPTSLTSFRLTGFNLKSLNGSAFEQIKSLQTLIIRYCNEVESLPDQVLPTSLLEIEQCPILERRYQKERTKLAYYFSHSLYTHMGPYYSSTGQRRKKTKGEFCIHECLTKMSSHHKIVSGQPRFEITLEKD